LVNPKDHAPEHGEGHSAAGFRDANHAHHPSGKSRSMRWKNRSVRHQVRSR
jgi:hypothetical protein